MYVKAQRKGFSSESDSEQYARSRGFLRSACIVYGFLLQPLQSENLCFNSFLMEGPLSVLVLLISPIAKVTRRQKYPSQREREALRKTGTVIQRELGLALEMKLPLFRSIPFKVAASMSFTSMF